MAEEAAGRNEPPEALSALEASLLLLGGFLVANWAIPAAAEAIAPDTVGAWAVSMHLPLLLLLVGSLAIARDRRPLLGPLYAGSSTALLAVSAACIGIAGGLLDAVPGGRFLPQVLTYRQEGWWRLAWIVVSVPVIEELYFRGVLQQALGRHVPLWGAAALSAAAFGVAHVGQPDLWLYALLGLAFACYAAGSRALLPAIVAHMGWNLGTTGGATAHTSVAGMACLLVAAGVVALGVALARRRTGGSAR